MTISDLLRPGLTERVASSRLTAVSVAVVRGTDVRAEVVGSSPATEGSGQTTDLRPAFSFTKTYLAAAACLLAHEGVLDLDAPVAAWVPESSLGDDVTLRRLLNHTAGVPDYGALREYHQAVAAHPGEPWSEGEFMAVARHAALFPPGRGWAYSNTGYFLVRLAIERATGGDLAHALQRLVFGPLGLHATSVLATADDMRALAAAPSRDRYHPGWVATGCVATTSAEAARFLDDLLEGRLLPAAWVEEMRVAIPVPNAGRGHLPSYGLGLMIDRGFPAGTMLGHTGGGPGYSAAVYRLERGSGERVTVGVMASDEDGLATEQLAHEIASDLSTSAV
ncbi:MAG: serine hydrolase domain-containing protein [Candidatus Dormibacteria bacterium]